MVNTHYDTVTRNYCSWHAISGEKKISPRITVESLICTCGFTVSRPSLPPLFRASHCVTYSQICPLPPRKTSEDTWSLLTFVAFRNPYTAIIESTASSILPPHHLCRIAGNQLFRNIRFPHRL